MAKYRETTFKKYLTEALSKDFVNSKSMFDQAVKNFKETKEVNATSLNLLSDIVRYIAKFTEEHNIVNQLPELKKAKESLHEAMNFLDKAYEKMQAGDAGTVLPKKGKKSALAGFDDDMPPVDDMDGEDSPEDKPTEGETDMGSDDIEGVFDDNGDDAGMDELPPTKDSSSDKLPPMPGM